MRLVEVDVAQAPTRWSGAELDELWARWRDGESFNSIAYRLGRPQHHVRRLVMRTGGMRPPERRAAAAHLSFGERESISRSIAAGRSARSIGAELGRAASTISREIARHGGRQQYRAGCAQQRAEDNRRRPKLASHPRLRAVVEDKLALRWSPDQIAAWLRLEHADDPRMQVADETIYRSLYDPRLHAAERTLTRRRSWPAPWPGGGARRCW